MYEVDMKIMESDEEMKEPVPSPSLQQVTIVTENDVASVDEPTPKYEHCSLIILDGHFFTIVSTPDSSDGPNMKVTARCNFCQKNVCGYLNSSSNFVRHIKRAHPGYEERYYEYKLMKGKKNRSAQSLSLFSGRDSTCLTTQKLGTPAKSKRSYAVIASETSTSTPNNDQPQQPQEESSLPPSQTMVSYSAKKSKKNNVGYSQAQFEDRLTTFIASTLSPLSLLSSPHFKNLFPCHEVMNPQTMIRRMSKAKDREKNRLIITLRSVPYVTVAFDAWNAVRAPNVTFLGVTVHYLDEYMNRHNAVLFCERYHDSQTYEMIAQRLSFVFEEYGISKKIMSCVIENGNSMMTYFRNFGIEDPLFSVNDAAAAGGGTGTGDDDDNNDTSTLGQELDFTQFDNDMFNEERVKFNLPATFVCVSQKLILVATEDYNELLNRDGNLKTLHMTTASKCNFLWKESRNPESRDVIKTTLGSSLVLPVASKWTSLYNAFCNILMHCDLDKGRNVNKALENLHKAEEKMFDLNDVFYLKLYTDIMKPIAQGLDIIQLEKNMYFARFIPTIHSIYSKLSRQLKVAENGDELQQNIARYIIEGLIGSLCTRFQNEINLTLDSARTKNAVMAAVLHPYYKFRWIRHDVAPNEIAEYRRYVATAIEEELTRRDLISLLKDDASSVDPNAALNDDFYEFRDGTVSVDEDSGVSLNLEVSSYFNDTRRTLDSLNDYPRIKNLFHIFNTQIPSSIPIEKLFAHAAAVSNSAFSANDEHFDTALFLYSNLNMR